MIKSPLVVLVVVSLLHFSVGCSTGVSRGTTPSVAFVIRNTGAVPPTPQQLASAYRALQGYIGTAGYVVAEDPRSAQFIVNAEFVPSPVDSTGGHARIVSVEPGAAFKKSLRGDANAGENPELRERLRDIERWIEAQSKTRIGESS